MDESSSEAAAAEQAVRVAGRTIGPAKGKGRTEDVLNALEAAEARHNRLQLGDTPACIGGHDMLSNSTQVPLVPAASSLERFLLGYQNKELPLAWVSAAYHSKVVLHSIDELSVQVSAMSGYFDDTLAMLKTGGGRACGGGGGGGGGGGVLGKN